MEGAPYRPRPEPEGRFLRRQLSMDNKAVVPLGKIVRVEVAIGAVPGRMNELESRPNARACIMVNGPIGSMFQALRQGPFQFADCFSWRERGKLCGGARRNAEEVRSGKPRTRSFRGQ